MREMKMPPMHGLVDAPLPAAPFDGGLPNLNAFSRETAFLNLALMLQRALMRHHLRGIYTTHRVIAGRPDRGQVLSLVPALLALTEGGLVRMRPHL